MAGVKGMRRVSAPSPSQAAAIRERIQAAKLVTRLEDFAFGKIKLSAPQVSAALGLLRKVVPDLSATDLDVSGEIATVIRKVYVDATQPRAAS